MKKLFLFLVLITLMSCTNSSEEYLDIRGEEYAGSQSCIQCHQNISELTAHNSHTKASMPGLKENILGLISDEQFAYTYNPQLHLKVQEHNDSVYQVVYKNGKPTEKYRFDVLMGAKHAQTSMFWHQNKLYELPISYYQSIHNWATSPGYDAHYPLFERMVKKDCFSCHSSNIKSPQPKGVKAGQEYGSTELSGQLDKNSIVYGIDCERCHGPAKKHVNHHLKFPKDLKAQFITTKTKLNNQQKLDQCAICHSGNNSPQLKSRFDFRPGDTLSQFFLSNPAVSKDAPIDVHGNQLELLKQSKCFTKDNGLNCITCHNPHTNAEKNTSYYSQICMSCHQQSSKNFCKVQPFQPSFKNNCVDCHMPTKSSAVISFIPSGSKKKKYYSLRTHKIGVYKKVEK